MPTTEENIELIETIKNPEKHYRIMISGYGAETTYTKVTKEVHDYWADKANDRLVDYCVSPDEESVDDVGDFLYDKKRDMYQMWYDNDSIVQNVWGASIEASCYLTVQQLVNNDHDADIIKELTDDEPIDIEKLTFVTEETIGGEDFIIGLKYDDEELENWGGDTNGKGYLAQMFET